MINNVTNVMPIVTIQYIHVAIFVLESFLNIKFIFSLIRYDRLFCVLVGFFQQKIAS